MNWIRWDKGNRMESPLRAGVALLVTGFVILRLPFRTIARQRERYERVVRGMTVQEVIGLMGEPTEDSAVGPELGLHADWWDGERLGQQDAARIRRVICYSTDTFFLPVTFAFSFDENGVIVGKHSYD